MSSETPFTPVALTFQKPQAKLVSPAARNLFGRSDASVVTQMLNEIIVADQKRACLKLNFDIKKEKPTKVEQQENVSDIDKTPEPRRRYHWKCIPDCEAPEFYSRRYKGKKSLMPVDLLNCEGSKASGVSRRSRTARRSLNGYLRSPSKQLSSKTQIIRPASAARLETSPLRVPSPQKQIDSPVSFDDACKNRAPLSVLRPLALHASANNQTTAKFTSPVKTSPLATTTVRSPLNLRQNESNCVRAIDFSDNQRKPVHSGSFVPLGLKTPTRVDPPSTTARLTPQTPAPSSHRMKEQKITDILHMKKPRRSALLPCPARKRLAMSQEEANPNVPSSKEPRLA